MLRKSKACTQFVAVQSNLLAKYVDYFMAAI